MTSAYASVAAIKGSAALNITGTGYDSQLLPLLEGVSRWVDAHCNRHFYVLTASRRFDFTGLVSTSKRRAETGGGSLWPDLAYTRARLLFVRPRSQRALSRFLLS